GRLGRRDAIDQRGRRHRGEHQGQVDDGGARGRYGTQPRQQLHRQFGPPLAVNHQGPFVATTISFNLNPGYSLSDATESISAAMLQIGVPAAIHGSFQGTARQFQVSLDNQKYLITAAIIAVYIVLGMLYESFVHPITILSTLPSAGVGAVM